MLIKTTLLLAALSSHLMAYVSWDGYIFRIENGTATLKSGNELIFVCDKSDVKVIDNHLIVDASGDRSVDIAISSGTAMAIANEFRRDRDGHRRDTDHDQGRRHDRDRDHGDDGRPCPPGPGDGKPDPEAKPEPWKSISLPVSRTY